MNVSPTHWIQLKSAISYLRKSHFITWDLFCIVCVYKGFDINVKYIKSETLSCEKERKSNPFLQKANLYK